MIVIVKSSDEKKIELTVEELKKYLEEARQEGYNEGYRMGSANVYPIHLRDDWQRIWQEYETTWTANAEGSISSDNIIKEK